MQKTQSTPIQWEFSQDNYDKLVKGHQSNWSVFLRDDTVHVCRVGGEEFYRFAVKKNSDDVYVADDIEIYVADDFYGSLRMDERTSEEIERHKLGFDGLAVNEVAGLLKTYFNIVVDV
jgi:hypothetical protein